MIDIENSLMGQSKADGNSFEVTHPHDHLVIITVVKMSRDEGYFAFCFNLGFTFWNSTVNFEFWESIWDVKHKSASSTLPLRFQKLLFNYSFRSKHMHIILFSSFL